MTFGQRSGDNFSCLKCVFLSPFVVSTHCDEPLDSDGDAQKTTTVFNTQVKLSMFWFSVFFTVSRKCGVSWRNHQASPSSSPMRCLPMRWQRKTEVNVIFSNWWASPQRSSPTKGPTPGQRKQKEWTARARVLISIFVDTASGVTSSQSQGSPDSDADWTCLSCSYHYDDCAGFPS